MESCKRASQKMLLAINIIIHVVILFTFLTIFFITYVSKVEQSVFTDQLGGLIDQNLSRSIQQLDPSVKNGIAVALSVLPANKLAERYSQPDESVVINNDWVKTLSILLAVCGVVILAIVIGLLKYSCIQCIPFLHLLRENAIIFLGVGAFEYYFFTRYAIKFIPAPPSLLVNTMLSTFKAYV